MNIILQKVLVATGVTVIVTVAVTRTLKLFGHIINDAYDKIEEQVDNAFDMR